MRPGALVLFRDYAAGDLAQSRLEGIADHAQHGEADRATTEQCAHAAPSQTSPPPTRLIRRNKLAPNLYIRGDGTLTYFFDEQTLHKLFDEARFECLEMQRMERTVLNRKEQLEMGRVFLQAKFRRKS